MNGHARSIGGPILTKPFLLLLALLALTGLLILWRFAAGLGPTTALSDGYPWGIWIAFDVVTGTALACGGYAVAILVYILNQGRYHPLVRPAILTSALGYTVAGLSLAVDVGRPWNFWRVPLFVNQWNLDSALLEVALCIMSYIGVLWIEVSPSLLERAEQAPVPLLAKASAFIRPRLERALVWIIALGLLLPTMHQSSLGTLMRLAGRKLHPLWQTPALPLLFLISCVAMGYAAVVFESTLAAVAFRRPPETRMLAGLSRAVVAVLFLFLAVRLVDVLARGQAARILALDAHALLFLLELAVLLAPALMLLSRAVREDRGRLFGAALLVMFGGAFYRFNSYLIAFNPGQGWSYFPAVPELMITIGFVGLEIALYVVIVKRFPILGGIPRPAPQTRSLP
jgi:Ni/Fe-hydrogenase subunit HybB-like protein